jgi:fatty-acyl-CoA synthase
VGLRFADAADEAYRYPLLITHLLRSAVDARTGAEIVGTDGRRYDYPELERRVGRLAEVLARHGVGQGDVVAVLDWDSHRYLEAYFAVPMMGAVLQTVNVRLSPDQIAYTLQSTGAKSALFHADFTALMEDLHPRLPALNTLILMHDGAAAATHDLPVAGEYEALLAAGDTPFAFEDFDENALATTFHTTGTTGLPKAVQFSHRQLVLHTLALMGTLANQPDGQCLRRGDVYMPITPMFHVHAWGIPYVATVLGLKQVYPGRYVAERLVQLKETEGVTFSHGVPTIVQMLVKALDGRRVEGPWKMIVGGSAFPTALRRAAAAAGISASAGYGMSETGPVLTIARGDGADEAANDVLSCRAGRAIPLVHLRLDGASAGEITVRAPWLTLSYAGDATASADLWRGGWMHTQDVAEIAPNGDVIIRDRIKDVIKTGGEWVSSVEVEELLMRHPAVEAAAVIGVPDAQWGERPLAFVVEHDAAPDAAALRAHLMSFVEAGSISRYAVPDRVIALADLPKTSVGKVDKKQLRLLAAREAAV